MNTEMTGQQAEPTADAAVDVVETVIWRYDNSEEITRGMLRDALQACCALERLAAAAESVTSAIDARDRGLPYDLTGSTRSLAAAVAACRAVGGAR